MEKYVVLLLSIISVIASPPRDSKHYRTDYTYNRKTDAFYKFHTEKRRGFYANQVCEIEGAKLMSVESHDDIIQVHSMFKQFPDLPTYAWVTSDGQPHESAEEQPIIYLSQELEEHPTGTCEVISRSGELASFPCFQLLPFVCKVKANDAPYDSVCDAYGTSYNYIPSVGSCYKIPEAAYSWNEAYSECRAEGSHLLVLNSVAESQAVRNLTIGNRVLGSRYPWFYFAGFRAAEPKGNETVVFKTIFNQTLEEAGYAEWSPNEPNNALGNELCGSFFRNNAKLNDANCSHQYGFICEKEVPKK